MGSGTEVASPGANPEIRLYFPHPQTQGWRHTARQAGPEEKKKSPFFPDPRTFKHVAISLRKQEIPPKPHRFPRRTPFQSIPPCWT